jgi:hypothetical protein
MIPTWIPVRRNETSRGTTLSNPDGTVRSLNPSHPQAPYGPYYWDTRPAGANGGYELCSVEGGKVAYSPVKAEIFVYGFHETHPTMPGFSAMTLEPIEL